MINLFSVGTFKIVRKSDDHIEMTDTAHGLFPTSGEQWTLSDLRALRHIFDVIAQGDLQNLRMQVGLVRVEQYRDNEYRFERDCSSSITTTTDPKTNRETQLKDFMYAVRIALNEWDAAPGADPEPAAKEPSRGMYALSDFTPQAWAVRAGRVHKELEALGARWKIQRALTGNRIGKLEVPELNIAAEVHDNGLLSSWRLSGIVEEQGDGPGFEACIIEASEHIIEEINSRAEEVGATLSDDTGE